MRGYVDAAAASGLEDCERLVENMETLEQEYQSHMESMEEQLRQAQAETCALQEGGENEAFSDRIKELTDELVAQITLREAAESAMHEEGGTADAEIR